MSKNDTWPSRIALEPLSNMDSAGSCDSVISMNSGYSEDSMEHLSPEERACLMYLQETIEALEVEDDSGLSNEEPELGTFGDKIAQIREKDTTSLTPEISRKSPLGCESPEAPPHLTEEPATTPSATENNTENLSLNHTSEPESNSDDTKEVDVAAQVAEVGPPASDVGIPSSAPQINVAVIPPPSDFMDEPDSPAQPEKLKYLPPSVGTANIKPGATVDVEQLRQRAITPTVNLEQLRQRAAIRKTSLVPSTSEEIPSKPPFDVSSLLSPPTLVSGHPVNPSPPLSPLPESPEPKTPPAVAPKPKKLPANILLKSHKTTFAPSDNNSGHLAPAGSDMTYLDHHKVRMEALRKLGLLKSDDEDPSTQGQKLNPKSRRSWAAPSPPISPSSSKTPPSTPSYSRVHSQPLASVRPHPVSPAALLLSVTSAAPRQPNLLPAPAAFSDGTDSPPSVSELSVSDVSDVEINHKPLTPSALIKQLSPPRGKSATLERSGLGLSSYTASQNFNESDFGQFRTSKTRPASMEVTKDFSLVQTEDADVEEEEEEEEDDGSESDMWMPLPVPSASSDDSQKLPRSHGVSVLISPRAENEEDRREALRKLGLLRD